MSSDASGGPCLLYARGAIMRTFSKSAQSKAELEAPVRRPGCEGGLEEGHAHVLVPGVQAISFQLIAPVKQRVENPPQSGFCRTASERQLIGPLRRVPVRAQKLRAHRVFQP